MTSKIIVQPPVTLTVTIHPMVDGTASVETRITPEDQVHTLDVVALSQVLLGIVQNYLLQLQQANQMLVGRRDGGKTE